MPTNTISNKATRTSYHHGDLRRALIEAATTILSETQRWDFSLREVARRAGVSHNAPYAHFADKRALLSAVAAVGFRLLRDRMMAAYESSQSAGEALYATARAYISFGIDDPAFYRLIFSPDLRSSGGLSSDAQAAADASRAVLADVMQRGIDEKSFSLDGDDATEMQMTFLTGWSLVHGFTMLALDNLTRLETPIDIDLAARNLTDRLLRGLAK